MTKLQFHLHPFPESKAGHSHEHAHILLPLHPHVRITTKDCPYVLEPNRLFFIPPNLYHHCHRSRGVLWINIPFSMIKEEDIPMLEQCSNLPLSDNICSVIELIKNEISINKKSDTIRYLYYYLYNKLVERHHHKSVQYIQENFSEHIFIATLAGLENYSTTHFSYWFKKQMGCTPSQYIQRIRIEKAKELLNSTNFRIIDIAMQVGYSNNASFTKAFKDLLKHTPAEYRKSCKK